MKRTPNQRDTEEIKEIWQGIDLWRIERRLTPEELAHRAEFPLERLRRGLKGEPEPIRDKLYDFALALNLSSGREGRFYEETTDTLSYEELKAIITSPLHPRQATLWDDWKRR